VADTQCDEGMGESETIGGDDKAVEMVGGDDKAVETVSGDDKAVETELVKETEEAPLETEEAPLETEEAPLETEEAPLETEEAPPLEVRNLCIIAHVDHGKTTLSDTLLSASGLLSSQRAGTACALDVGLEAERGITIYSSAVGLPFPEHDLHVTLIDCPGHAEFGSEVTAAMRLTDGALLLVDASEGVCVQTEAVLRQALAEGVQPVLVLNKLDRLLPAPEREPAAESGEGESGGNGGNGGGVVIADEPLERALRKMRAAIEQVNAIIGQHNGSRDASRGELAAAPVSLEDGTVCFGSAYFGWLTTLRQFAALHASRKAIESGLDDDERASLEAKAMRVLTGTRADDHLKKMVLRPLAVLHALAGRGDAAAVDSRLQAIGGPAAALNSAEKALRDPKALRRATFRKLVPAGPTLLAMIKQHLPSPQAALRRRAKLLCSGSDAEGGQGGEGGEGKAAANWTAVVAAADATAPLYIYVAKHQNVPGSRMSAAAVCRVLSGTLRAGAEVYVAAETAGGVPPKGRVTRVLALTPHGPSGAMASAKAGAIVAIIGLEKVLPRCGTVSSDPTAPPLATMKFELSPVEFRALESSKGGGARKLAEALPALRRSDPLLQAYFDHETGEHIVAAAGELHMEVSLHKLRELMGTEGAKLVARQARFAHRESVSSATPRSASTPGALGKSANKHNRFWMVASPLAPEVVAAIESGAIHAGMSATARARALCDLPVGVDGELDESIVPWEAKDARKILGFAPDGAGANLLVDSTFGIQGIETVAEHLVAAFNKLCEQGPLCRERLRGVRIDLVDAKIHGEAAQKKESQIVPAAHRAMEAAVLGATPIILEKVMAVNVSAPLPLVGNVYEELAMRRAIDISHVADATGTTAAEQAVCTVTGVLPLEESPGLTEAFRGRLSGRSSSLRMVFHGWSAREGSAWMPTGGGEAAGVVQRLRGHKGMPAGPMEWSKVADRL